MLGCRFRYFFAQRNAAAYGAVASVLVAVLGFSTIDALADDYLDAIDGETAKLSQKCDVSYSIGSCTRAR